MPTTSVVVLSHNPGEWLAACLDSVVEQADEVVMVDNGSPDRLASRIGEAHGTRVVRSRRNLGYAAGVNLGIRESSGDLIALLNDDALAGPNWLASAGAALADPRVACVVPKVIRHGWYREVVLRDVHEAPGDHRELGCRLLSVTSNGREVLPQLLGPGIHELEGAGDAKSGSWRWRVPCVPFYVPVCGPDGEDIRINGEIAPPGPLCRLLNKAGGYLLQDGVLGDIGDESPDDGRWDKPSEPFFGSGTALVTRRDVIDRIGRLPEPYFAYYEDADWCWRARLCGLTVRYDPEAVVEHRHSATSGGAGPFVNRLASRNRSLTLVRNAPGRRAVEGARRAFAESRAARDRLDLVSKLAWASATRWSLSRRWVFSPEEIWEQWVDVGSEWDRRPVHER